MTSFWQLWAVWEPVWFLTTAAIPQKKKKKALCFYILFPFLSVGQYVSKRGKQVLSMNAWSSMAIVLVASIYLLHYAGIYPPESIKAESHVSLGHTSSTSSPVCSAMRWAMATTELPQESRDPLSELSTPTVMFYTYFQTFRVSLSHLSNWWDMDEMTFVFVTFWESGDVQGQVRGFPWPRQGSWK